MRWMEHVARVRKEELYNWVLVGKPERDYLEDPCVDGRIVLRWIFRKRDVGTWDGLI